MKVASKWNLLAANSSPHPNPHMKKLLETSPKLQMGGNQGPGRGGRKNRQGSGYMRVSEKSQDEPTWSLTE